MSSIPKPSFKKHRSNKDPGFCTIYKNNSTKIQPIDFILIHTILTDATAEKSVRLLPNLRWGGLTPKHYIQQKIR